MNITKKAITDDIAFISSTLKQQDVAIPPFLSCAMPGLAVMLCMLIMPLWNLFSNLAYFHKYGLDLMARLDDLIPLLMFFIFGFFIFIGITSMRSKYLSLPVEIREQSLIVNLIRRKTMYYAGVWLGLNILTSIAVKLLTLSLMLSYTTQFASLLILWFIALADLGRYDLAVFSAVIKAWRDGDKLDPEQLKRLDI
ncbi:conjugal transfer entry exclusion protein TraS [Aeromonas sobria]|uniref:conjugal transfer entry exclusion protein TraS n=1 Tax=Aeromonas sobria TaxID=646 RepID=UPI001116E19C|nr:conjugal transfer entry exclusion protein TraS [Aeromonas sobria]TNH79158.1 conjugal transfer entry exclusion protein TraS [Aeromonas sobria]